MTTHLFEFKCPECGGRFYEPFDNGGVRPAEICPFCGAMDKIGAVTNEWVVVEVVEKKKKRKK